MESIPLASVEQYPYLQGQKATEILLELISSNQTHDGNNVAYTALISSIFDGFGPVVDVLLDKAAIHIDKTGVSGNTPLMWAAFFGKDYIAKGK